ncbi:DeoR/GlpR family DNA-binding transcription regulator [Sphingomonas sp. MG17]|uniref:DeoR/GlpR family DNA-binding transcription regulator n=1 Tax=Sphingomonas tagetis TaxID=2949092 RepID=A0A9X2HJJ0_9SPHN|nr:DeoR/GlpR family DNA-binding transcription regulator [Sphingomonas tagetis]MCP3730259.1 DeoR/GlpR family DNA-binding transcription regulator [Sphingomonas tagetis]
MHSSERERLILDSVADAGFVAYRQLEERLNASPATIRRDLARLERLGRLERVHGGARSVVIAPTISGPLHLAGTPFDEALQQHLPQKRAIGRAAAGLCRRGEGVMIDGGTTTFQMCAHLDGLELQVLTSSLNIVNALLPQAATRLLVPSGALFREQNIILAPAGEESMPRFHAPKLFMGAAAVGAQGIMQADIILVANERRFVDRAEEVIILVDSSKFIASSGAVVCGLEEIDTLITDSGIADAQAAMVERAGVKLVVVDP